MRLATEHRQALIDYVGYGWLQSHPVRHAGFRVSRSAESVGRLTTLSVVRAIFLVIVIDAAFSILFARLHI